MQKINPLLDQTSAELKKNSNRSLTEAGQINNREEPSLERVSEPGQDHLNGQAIDHVDAINQIFAEFEFAYHNQFHKAFAVTESLVIAKKYWLSNLERYSPHQIIAAAKRVVQTQEYLPSIAAFLKTCEEGKDLFGLPSTRQAYVEACSAPSPKKEFAWTHLAIYYAGKAAGWFLLANEAETTAYPVFKYHYEQLCRRVVDGEEFTVEVPDALSENIDHKLDNNEVKARITKLKEDLGL